MTTSTQTKKSAVITPAYKAIHKTLYKRCSSTPEYVVDSLLEVEEAQKVYDLLPHLVGLATPESDYNKSPENLSIKYFRRMLGLSNHDYSRAHIALAALLVGIGVSDDMRWLNITEPQAARRFGRLI